MLAAGPVEAESTICVEFPAHAVDSSSDGSGQDDSQRPQLNWDFLQLANTLRDCVCYSQGVNHSRFNRRLIDELLLVAYLHAPPSVREVSQTFQRLLYSAWNHAYRHGTAEDW